MDLALLPLLHVQRELYLLPRGPERFQAYIEAATGGTEEMVLPLASMNPMGKEHCLELVEALLALGAEGAVGAALEEARPRLSGVPGSFKVGLVVTDDLKGGWTNHHFVDASYRLEIGAMVSRGFVVVPCWTSEAPDLENVRRGALEAVYRTAHLLRHGRPRDLREAMAQEGRAMAFAGALGPVLLPDDLEYTREVVRPHLSSSHFPTVFACLYGDEAARSVGLPPLGLSPFAGLALARADALEGGAAPEAALLEGATAAGISPL